MDIKDLIAEMQAEGLDISTETTVRRVEAHGDVHGVDELMTVMQVLKHFEYKYCKDTKEHTFVHSAGITFKLKDWWLEGYQIKV